MTSALAVANLREAAGTQRAELATIAATGETATGAWVGTPLYMAPEQFEGRADARCDQFSLCVTIYEALVGAHPFRSDSLAALRARVQEGRIRPAPRGLIPGWLLRCSCAAFVRTGTNGTPTSVRCWTTRTVDESDARSDPPRRSARPCW